MSTLAYEGGPTKRIDAKKTNLIAFLFRRDIVRRAKMTPAFRDARTATLRAELTCLKRQGQQFELQC